jgi:hypothetical protein
MATDHVQHAYGTDMNARDESDQDHRAAKAKKLQVPQLQIIWLGDLSSASEQSKPMGYQSMISMAEGRPTRSLLFVSPIPPGQLQRAT